MEVEMKPKIGDRVKVTWVESGNRNEKILDDELQVHDFMCQLEQRGISVYFYDWCK